MRFMHKAAEVDFRGMVHDVSRMRCRHLRTAGCALAVVVAVGAAVEAGQTSSPPRGQAPPATVSKTPPKPPDPTPPADYVIGPDDVLAVVFWREKDLSAEVVVRPDGMITLPLVNDLKAAGLTTDQLRAAVVEAAGRFVEDPSATIVVKQINSRRIFITGQVGRPGPYALSTSMNVLQALSIAGGVGDFAKKDRILVIRKEGAQTKTYKFNYKEVIKGKKLEQNIELRPGDTIIVP